MKKVNTYISNNCTKKALVYCDKNGHYILVRYDFTKNDECDFVMKKKLKFKHIESLQRAVNKWIKTA